MLSSLDNPESITDEQLTSVCKILKKFPHEWESIGTELGFTTSEMEAIKSRPLLLSTAPLSWLNVMLSDWHQWAPTDSRGSKCYPTLHSLRTAVSKAGLGRTAEDLDKLQGMFCGCMEYATVLGEQL
jgi:hypothetical protein